VATPPPVNHAGGLALLRANPVLERVQALLCPADEPLYLVGGALRDAFVGRDPVDLDFAGPGAIEVARRFAANNRAHMVMLHELPPIARVPVYMPGASHAFILDFCGLRGPSIEADLAARDFTINALALDLSSFALLDPTGGLDDLHAGIVRAVGAAAFAADTVRCVRAYRFCAALDFRLEEQTRGWLRAAAGGIAHVEGQRVGDELLRLLDAPRVGRTIAEMDADGILSHVLPELEEGRDMDQPGFHHLSVQAHAIEALSSMEALLARPETLLPRSAAIVAEYLRRPRTRPLLLMAALLHDVGKPACHTREPEGRIRFTGHPSAGAAIAARILQRLAWPARIRDGVVALVAHHMRVFDLARLAIDGGRAADDIGRTISMGAIRRMFRQVHGHEPGLMLTALADSHASRGPAKSPGYDAALATVCDQMLRGYIEYTTVQAPEPLLTGKDLIAEGFAPGPIFSALLQAVEDSRSEGRVSNRQQALDLARRLARERAGADETKE
jgi:putative nucleotidyltransferase with HDIG domain